MITLAWIFGSIVGYLAIGFGVAAWDLPKLHQRVKDDPDHAHHTWQRQAMAAREIAFATAIFWPLRWPYLVITRMADNTNPDLIARELRRREQEIAEREQALRDLERSMGLGDTVPPAQLEDFRPGGPVNGFSWSRGEPVNKMPRNLQEWREYQRRKAQQKGDSCT